MPNSARTYLCALTHAPITRASGVREHLGSAVDCGYRHDVQALPAMIGCAHHMRGCAHVVIETAAMCLYCTVAASSVTTLRAGTRVIKCVFCCCFLLASQGCGNEILYPVYIRYSCATRTQLSGRRERRCTALSILTAHGRWPVPDPQQHRGLHRPVARALPSGSSRRISIGEIISRS